MTNHRALHGMAIVLCLLGLASSASAPAAAASGTASGAVSGLDSRSAASSAGPSARWAWPLQPRPVVARGFVRPKTAYAAGHRGVDLAAQPGDAVLAVADGQVTHVGVINGRGTISVLHGTGIRSTHEPVEADVAVGQSVSRGQVIGVVSDVAGHCAPATCLHLGAIRAETYLDPLTLLTVPRIILMPPVKLP